MRAWLYRPARIPIRGAYLVTPGLHFAGPADPRLDRFCQVLAGSGFTVLAPFLPDFLALQVKDSLTGDLARCLQLLLDQPQWTAGRFPALFSISFGALPALRVAALPQFRETLSRIFIFGGYANFTETLEYCLTGNINGIPHRPRDPLNQPVIFLNLLEALATLPQEPSVPKERSLLTQAWRQYIEATWGRPEMKEHQRYKSVATSIASSLPTQVQYYFLLGCGLEPGSHALCKRALEASNLDAVLDPTLSVADITRPITIVHGKDDDVIPYLQSHELHRRLPNSELFITGLVDHTRAVTKLRNGLSELQLLYKLCTRMARITG